MLFVNLPVLLAQAAALAANGLSPLSSFPKLLPLQAALAMGTLMPCAALAAIMPNLVQVLVAAMAVYAGLYGTLLAWWRFGGSNPADWGGAAPVIETFRTALTALFTGGAMVFQYWRRSTGAARWVFGCGILAPFVFSASVPWDFAFRLTAPRQFENDAGLIGLTFDRARVRTWPGGSVHWRWTRRDVGISVPIQITGIPAGMLAYSDHATVTIEAPDGETWNSGWDSLNAVQSAFRTMYQNARLLPGDGGPYWFYANIDRSVVITYFHTPVHLRATVAFTLLGPARTTELDVSNRLIPIPGHGFCHLGMRGGYVVVSCFAPLEGASEKLVRFQSLDSGEIRENGYVDGLPPSVSAPNLFGVWENFTWPAFGPPPAPYSVFFETRQAVAHCERVLDVPGVRLDELRAQ